MEIQECTLCHQLSFYFEEYLTENLGIWGSRTLPHEIVLKYCRRIIYKSSDHDCTLNEMDQIQLTVQQKLLSKSYSKTVCVHIRYVRLADNAIY